MKNITYRLQCDLCSERYVGETKCQVQDKLMEHRRAARNRGHREPLGCLYVSTHKDDQVPTVPF